MGPAFTQKFSKHLRKQVNTTSQPRTLVTTKLAEVPDLMVISMEQN